MGNNQPDCCCFVPTSISFEYDTKLKPIETTNLILIEEGRKDKSEIILNNIKSKDEKILHSLNRIKDQIGNLDDNKLIALKECLKYIISKITNKEKMKYYKDIIDKFSKNSFNLKNIKNFCDIFICIYEEKKVINKDKY